MSAPSPEHALPLTAAEAEVEPLRYTNRRGVEFVLCQTTTKAGRKRFVFARAPRGVPVAHVPEGWEIAETVNGVVSLRRAKPRRITDDELHTAREAVSRLAQRPLCRVEIEDDALVVYEPAGSFARAHASASPGDPAAVWRDLEQRARYEPALRFVLVDAERRIFRPERMRHRGARSRWASVHGPGQLAKVVRLASTIGTDRFYGLI